MKLFHWGHPSLASGFTLLRRQKGYPGIGLRRQRKQFPTIAKHKNHQKSRTHARLSCISSDLALDALNNPKSYNVIEFIELNPLFPFSALFRFRGWSTYLTRLNRNFLFSSGEAALHKIAKRFYNLTPSKEMDTARSVPMNSKWPHNTIFAILSSTYNGHRTSGTDPSGGKTGNEMPLILTWVERFNVHGSRLKSPWPRPGLHGHQNHLGMSRQGRPN